MIKAYDVFKLTTHTYIVKCLPSHKRDKSVYSLQNTSNWKHWLNFVTSSKQILDLYLTIAKSLYSRKTSCRF